MNHPNEPAPRQNTAARLTAWAVGEIPSLSSPVEAGSLDGEPAFRAEADATRDFCQLLSTRLRAPHTSAAALRLSPARLRSLEEAAREARSSRRPSLLTASFAAAACFAVMTAVFTQARQGVPKPNPATAAQLNRATAAEVDDTFKLATFYYDLGEPENAEAWLSKVLVLAPDHAEARRLLAWGDLEIRAFRKEAGEPFALHDRAPAQAVTGETMELKGTVNSYTFSGADREDDSDQWKFNTKGQLIASRVFLSPGRTAAPNWKLSSLNDPSLITTLRWLDPSQSDYRPYTYWDGKTEVFLKTGSPPFLEIDFSIRALRQSVRDQREAEADGTVDSAIRPTPRMRRQIAEMLPVTSGPDQPKPWSLSEQAKAAIDELTLSFEPAGGGTSDPEPVR